MSMSTTGQLLEYDESRSPMAETEETPDEVLVARAQRGDRPALEALVRRHQRSVFKLCMRYVRDADDAADLVQRTFMRAMAKLGELRDAEVFRTWILRIGANLALNYLRDNARFVSEESVRNTAPAALAAPPAAAARLESDETTAALRRAVDGLATKQRMTLELRVYEEMSFREIALALGTTEGAAKVNFHYAVRNLRARLGPGADLETKEGKGKGK
jgi:RNA polymerase sigma-70 factor (ECF subfamily)